MSKIVSLTNQKGGVGKTTTSVNLAVSFAVSEVKTLLIDLDPQSNATTGLDQITDDPKGTIYDAIIRGSKVKDIITNTELEFLDMITSTNDLVGAEVELVNIMAREHQLEKALKPISKKYDYEIKVIAAPIVVVGISFGHYNPLQNPCVSIFIW